MESPWYTKGTESARSLEAQGRRRTNVSIHFNLTEDFQKSLHVKFKKLEKTDFWGI